MNNKRFKMFFSIILIVIILAMTGFYIFKKLSLNPNSIGDEYVPQAEISDEQFRRTIVKLYFKEINSNNLKYESRSIDSKELLSNPYLALINLLLSGPSIEGLEKIIPDGTTVNSAKIDGNKVTIDLSSSFISSTSDVNIASNMVYSIVNTLTELTEVDSVKFVIDGNENANFINCNFSLKDVIFLLLQ